MRTGRAQAARDRVDIRRSRRGNVHFFWGCRTGSPLTAAGAETIRRRFLGGRPAPPIRAQGCRLPTAQAPVVRPSYQDPLTACLAASLPAQGPRSPQLGPSRTAGSCRVPGQPGTGSRGGLRLEPWQPPMSCPEHPIRISRSGVARPPSRRRQPAASHQTRAELQSGASSSIPVEAQKTRANRRRTSAVELAWSGNRLRAR